MASCCSKAHLDLCSNERPVKITKHGHATNMPPSRIENVKFGTPKGNACASDDSLHDIEKGYPGGYTHISIVITGMTCTGCSKKAMNSLSRISGVRSPRVNFVASTGEFDLDQRLDPAVVIARFECETGFKSSRLTRNFQRLDVVMSKIEAKQLEHSLPVGIESISRIDGKTCSIIFDPSVIGARSVFSNVPSHSLTRPRNDSALINQKLAKMMWMTAFSAACTIPVAVMSWSYNSLPSFKRSIVALILATCVQAVAVSEFYVGAVKSLIFSKVIEMDMLIAISTTAAYGYSVIAFALTTRGYDLAQEEIFETSSLLTTLVLLGRLISLIARSKAFAVVSMKSLQAETALLVNGSGKTAETDARLLQFRDIIMIAPHTKIVTDGKVIDGSGEVDESAITGESTLVAKEQGSYVIAGTVNGSSPLTIRLTRLPGQNSITDLADLVGNALTAKPPIQDLADKVASWFIPVVVGTSCIVLVVWLCIALTIRNNNASESIGLAISYWIAVLAVSCPCALGLAVPMVLVIAGGMAAKFGVIIKRASVLERAYRTTDVVFDKTGTLTTGHLEVIEDAHYDQSFQLAEIKSVVFALVKDNSHPVSSAIADWLQRQHIKAARVEGIQSIPGFGIKAHWKGNVVRAGSPSWLGIETHPKIDLLVRTGTTTFGVIVGSKLVAAYGLKSTLRPEVNAVIDELHQRKITCHIVSGDGAKAVENAAQAVGIENTASSQIPASKQEYVKRLIDQGKTVLFCGDGTNDAVAVAQAHIGVQIGSVSDVTRGTADVILTGRLDGILKLLDISKAAFIRIVFNFVWSALYNFFAILLAAGAFVRVRIPPAYAGLGEIVSILPVILVALTLTMSQRKA